jgi:hypothetical protein
MKREERSAIDSASCELAQALAIANLLFDEIQDDKFGLLDVFAGIITVITVAKQRIDDIPYRNPDEVEA